MTSTSERTNALNSLRREWRYCKPTLAVYRETKGASLPTSLAARLDSLMSLSVKPSPT